MTATAETAWDAWSFVNELRTRRIREAFNRVYGKDMLEELRGTSAVGLTMAMEEWFERWENFRTLAMHRHDIYGH